MTQQERHDELMLLVVVVNYRTPALTLDCLRSLEREIAGLPASQVSLVDNASGDGSAERLRAAAQEAGWTKWLRILEAPENLGFAGGNNFAIRQSPRARYVLLLNSDTVTPGNALRYCVQQMAEAPDLAALSCRLVGPAGETQTQARRFPKPWREILSATGLPWRLPRRFGWCASEDPTWDRGVQARDVDWLGGAFLMLRSEALRKVGLLDESFFFYGEDIELCHRLRKAGYRCRYDPRVSVTHLGGQSSAGSGRPEEKPAYWQARYRVQKQCYGRLAASLVRSVDRAAWGWRLLKARALKGKRPEQYHRARVVWSHLHPRAKPTSQG